MYVRFVIAIGWLVQVWPKGLLACFLTQWQCWKDLVLPWPNEVLRGTIYHLQYPWIVLLLHQLLTCQVFQMGLNDFNRLCCGFSFIYWKLELHVYNLLKLAVTPHNSWHCIALHKVWEEVFVCGSFDLIPLLYTELFAAALMCVLCS